VEKRIKEGRNKKRKEIRIKDKSNKKEIK